MPLVPVQPNVVDDTIAVGVEQGAVYSLIGPDGLRVAFNDRSDPDFIGFLTSPPSGIDSPEVRDSSDLLVEADGGVHGDFYFGRRPFGLEGIIDPTPGDLDYTEVLTVNLTNIVDNPSFEVNTSTWSAFGSGGGTLTGPTRVASTLGQGGFAGRVGVTGTTGAGQVILYRGNSAHAETLNAGEFYALMGRVRIDMTAGTMPTNLRIRARTSDSSGAFLGVVTVDSVAAPVNGTVYALGAVVSAASLLSAFPTAAYVDFHVEATHVAGTDYTLTIDNALLAVTPNLPAAYFDGDTDPTGAAQRTAWVGAAGASRSVLYDVTREPLTAAAVTNRRISRLQRASRALRADSRLEWTPASGVPVRVTGRRAAPLRITDRHPKRFSLSMVAADPRIYAQSVSSVAGTIGAATVNVAAAGNATTPPTITVRNACTGPIVLTNGADSIVLNLTLVANDVLVVDFYAHTVTLNGADRYDALDFTLSSWWELAPGVNPIVVNAASGAASWSMTWRDAWE